MPKLIKDDPTSSDVHVDTIMDNTRKKQRRLKKRKMFMEESLKKESKNVPTNPELYARVKTATKAKFDVYPSAYANAWLVAEYKRRGGKYKVAKSDKPLKDPKGGLTQAGRNKYNRETGSKLKAGVKGKADTPEKMRRKGSFLTRFFTNPSGPMIKPNGEPTRLALSAAAWGEPVPKNRSDAARLAAKGRNLLDRYEANKVKKGESAGHPFRGNQWTRGASGGGSYAQTAQEIMDEERAAKDPTPTIKPQTTSARPKVRQAKDIDDAIKRILNGEIVEVKDVKDIHTVLEKLAEIAKDAKEKGKDAPKYDLCQVSVAGSNLFCGSKLKSKEYPDGVPRIKMPQIGGNPEKGSIADKTFPRNPWDDKEVNGAEPFVAHLKKMGIKSKKESVPAASLKASQGELVGSKVAKMMVDKGFDVTKNPLFVSSDGYVIDGHHRWAAAVGRDSSDGKLGNLKMNIIRIDAPISEVLKIANEWTESVGLKPAKGVNKISKREPICIGCQENNTVSKGESAGHPFRGNQWKKVASIHANRIIGQLHGKMSRTHTQMEVEGIMENLAPVIHAAVEQLHSEGASDKPLLVNGKKQSMNGNTVTSRGILDMVADELGVEAVSQGADFSSKKIFKAGRVGDKDGHPFHGNQHTGGKGGGAKLPSPSKGKPRPKPPMKRGEPQLKTRLTIIDEPSKKKAQKVFEYMIIPARKIKKPNVRAYAVSRTNQMTSGIARPKGMSAKYNMTVDQVRGIEIMLSKIFASGRKKYNI